MFINLVKNPAIVDVKCRFSDIIPHYIHDSSIKHYNKVYLTMLCMAYSFGGCYSSDLINVGLESFPNEMLDFSYFDYEGGKPLIDFIMVRYPGNSFVKFLIEKIMFHYKLNVKSTIDSAFFLSSMEHYCFPQNWKTITINGRSYGTNVSDKISSFNTDIFNECCKFDRYKKIEAHGSI